MSTEVVMPQMGESIAEGTITKWLKQVGEKVERDEPLFEISTDKVDAEIPSPAAGVLTEIKFKEGDTVEVNTVVAVLDGDGASAPAPQATAAQPAAQTSSAQAAVSSEPPPPPPAQEAKTDAAAPQAQQAEPPVSQTEQSEVAGRSYDAERPGAKQEGAQASAAASSYASAPTGEQSVEDLRRTRSSPLVRNIAKEHGIDISRLEGTGMSGRVTKNDILSYIESGAAMTPQQAMQTGQSGQAASAQAAPSQTAPTVAAPTVQPAAEDRVEQMSVMRKKIAEHMTMSRRTSAHVTTVYEIDMTRIARLRDKHKREFQERTGTKLTYMPFIFQAITSAIRKFPVFNSQVSGEQIIYKRDINLGMAVALDWGLIVPVIKRADDLSISGLARAANDLADRARAKQLKPDEVAGGTFTITNPGVFGGLFGTPIINQPQVAILGVGTIEKRPKVVTSPEGDDYIAIRSMAYFALTFDHRIIDGSDAEKFLGYVKELLEAGQFTV
ncbi:MAG: 2-oxoglutarate dehydrogenase, E2 component, dihydrolipoamide succinyltransferase [Acidobacteria bacterium]|nr:2-oxoglutarate dehydrogenase, E2 component, dihydrolipoamide succinyltransferase [Acidobacteriota bacterium]